MNICLVLKSTKKNENEIYSLLSGKGFFDKEYELALKFWNKFGMKKMKEYEDFHFKYALNICKNLELDAYKIMVCVHVNI